MQLNAIQSLIICQIIKAIESAKAFAMWTNFLSLDFFVIGFFVKLPISILPDIDLAQ